MRASRQEIDSFLESVRNALTNGNYTFIDRRKNLDSMARYGLLVQDVLDAIEELSCSNYIKGPDQDHDPSELDPMWVFKKSIEGNIFYIKIKIILCDSSLRIISFHIDEP